MPSASTVFHQSQVSKWGEHANKYKWKRKREIQIEIQKEIQVETLIEIQSSVPPCLSVAATRSCRIDKWRRMQGKTIQVSNTNTNNDTNIHKAINTINHK